MEKHESNSSEAWDLLSVLKFMRLHNCDVNLCFQFKVAIINSVASCEMCYLPRFVWFTVTWKKSKERKGPSDVGFIAVYLWKYPEKSCKLGQERGLNYYYFNS